MGGNDTRKSRGRSAAKADEPLRLVPGVGEQTDADGFCAGTSIRERRCPGHRPLADPSTPSCGHGRRNTDVREVHPGEGAATLSVRYQQFHHVRTAADIGRATVVQLDNRLELDVSEAPDPDEDRGSDAVRKTALAPFLGTYATAEVVRDELVYLRERWRPPLPTTPDAPLALLRTGKRRPDGELHLVHDLLVETTGPFEHFRVVVDAISGKRIWTALTGKYATATLTVFRPDPVTKLDNGALSSESKNAELKAFIHDAQAEIAPADPAGKFDATAMPSDTRITVRTLSLIVEHSDLTDIRVTETGAIRSTSEVTGGTTASIEGFRLAAHDHVSADITLGFSHQGEHLTDYPLIATQVRDGQVAGRMTMEITAIKDLDECVRGNPRSLELHISTCPFWDRMTQGNKIPFAYVEKAVAWGYNGCAYCLPDVDTGQDQVATPCR
ncbi:hypothetical protein [Streptomyces sp. NPDC058667]|uniref:hypothetical protein n=1 Tax=Streptomyces sp. NPDC058667 TaxID=3346588 RepID=UPI003659EF33